jgi:hypothetical protein
MTRPNTEFDWTIYANATLAGLSTLIPIPFMDWAFEEFFRRRMLPAIAARRKQKVSPAVIEEFRSKDSNRSCLHTCLTLPLTGLVILIRRLSRKILYFLTIQEATDKLSYYWHQAFLLDYMTVSGHLAEVSSARLAERAMYQVLEQQTTTSPLRQLAGRLTSSTRHVFRSLIRARRQGQEDAIIAEKKLQMLEHWSDFSGYFEQLAARYDQSYQRLKTQPDSGNHDTQAK